MTDINSILTSKYPTTPERIEGQLVYLEKYGITRLNVPTLQQKTNLDFFKAKFFTGLRKFTTTDIVVGLSKDSQEVFLLANLISTDKYSDLVDQFEKINGKDIDPILINEIIELYRETGAKITEIDQSINLYQIWLGEIEWRVMSIDNITLKIKTTPNSSLSKTKGRWWQKIFELVKLKN